MGAEYAASSLPFVTIAWSKPEKYMVLYHAFGFLWCLAFIQAYTQFVLASSTAIWYYAQGPDSQGAHKPVSRSFYRGIRYHLGSIAFGSLIVAIVQAIRLIMLYIHVYLHCISDLISLETNERCRPYRKQQIRGICNEMYPLLARVLRKIHSLHQ
jgi:hypothetical protein